MRPENTTASTIGEALRVTVSQLKQSESPQLDAELLISHLLRRPREYIIAHGEEVLTEDQLSGLKKLVTRRTQGEPLAYIEGSKEFWGLKFEVNRDTLIPRPETELVVELALKHIESSNKEQLFGLDLATGSGNIPISIAKSSPKKTIFDAVDVSTGAISVAKRNVNTQSVSGQVRFIQEDINDFQTNNQYDIITANLPYIPTDELPDLSVTVRKYEPVAALDGGEDGLKYFPLLIRILSKNLAMGGIALAEIHSTLAQETEERIKALANNIPDLKLNLSLHKDLAGHDRVFEITKP